MEGFVKVLQMALKRFNPIPLIILIIFTINHKFCEYFFEILMGILVIVILISTVSCLRAAGRADKWSEEIIRKEHDN